MAMLLIANSTSTTTDSYWESMVSEAENPKRRYSIHLKHRFCLPLVLTRPISSHKTHLIIGGLVPPSY